MIPLATTTISVVRGADLSDVDPWDRTPTAGGETIAAGVRAVIDSPSGQEGGPGDTETLQFTLMCDPTDVTFRDTIVDETTGESYQVVWTKLVPAPPGSDLDHVQAGLKQVTGFGNP